MTLSTRFRTALPFPAARGLALGGLGVAATTHLAVVAGVLSHTAVSGGRVQDQEAGRVVAVASLASLLLISALTVRATTGPGRPGRGARRAMAVGAAACAVSAPAQFVGTEFERAVMTPTAAVLALAYARMAVSEPGGEV